MITAVPGVRAGHWTDEVGRTGCTVVLFPDGTVASGEVRGGAPATREFALLEPTRLVGRIDAVALCGGSAFGLAAADGVVRFCEERGMGFPTVGGPVPIVVAMGVYDLAEGDPAARPGPEHGYAACESAGDGDVAGGVVGAGTGATVDKWRGRETTRPGGVGHALVSDGDLVVAALMVVNAFGNVLAEGERPDPALVHGSFPHAEEAFESTIVGVVATNAVLDKSACLLVAGGAHDGLARAVDPPHTSYDGDAVVVAATGQVRALPDRVRALAVHAADRAVRAGAPPATAGDRGDRGR